MQRVASRYLRSCETDTASGLGARDLVIASAHILLEIAKVSASVCLLSRPDRVLRKTIVNFRVEGVLMFTEAEYATVCALQPRTEGAQRSRKRCGVHYPMAVAAIRVRDRRIRRPAMLAASNDVQRRHRRRTCGAKKGCGGVVSLTKNCARCHPILH